MTEVEEVSDVVYFLVLFEVVGVSVEKRCVVSRRVESVRSR